MRLQTKTRRAARPDRCAAGPTTNRSRTIVYPGRRSLSNEKLFRAADVLLLLQLPLSRLQRLAYWQLFERRLGDAYMAG